MTDTERLQELVECWEQHRDHGRNVTAEELCRDYPELLSALHSRIRALESLNWLLDSRADDDATTDEDGPSSKEPTRWVGRYQLERRLGFGGVGEVWLATDPELQRRVAVKLPRPDRLATLPQVDKLLDEARKAASLKHSGIVPIFDVGREGDACFIVSEFMAGGDLAEHLLRRRFTAAEAVTMAADVAEALHFAHLRGFVHRDVKPANILLDDRGRAHVADFGIAATEHDLRCDHGSTAGTVAYMSPEQLSGETGRMDARSDIYSLGVVLYELLTGRRPFADETGSELPGRISTGDTRSPPRVDTTLPAALDRIVARTLAQKPTDRYSTALELAEELRRVERQLRSGRGGQQLLKWVSVTIIAAVGLSASALWIALYHDGANQDHSQTLDLHLAQRVGLNVVVWNPKIPGREGLSLTHPGVVPLRPDDQIRIEARLDGPQYAYLLWIEGSGKILPVYPWLRGDWRSLPNKLAATEHLSLPPAIDERWPMEATGSTELLILLVRPTPLPGDVDLNAILSGMPVPRSATHRLVWFRDDEVVFDDLSADRGPKLREPVQADEPIMKLLQALNQRLRPHFTSIRAVGIPIGKP